MSGAPTETISGEVKRVFFASPKYSAGVIATRFGEQNFAGPFAVAVGERVCLTGSWGEHPKYGWQFKAEALTYLMPDASADALAAYIAGNKKMKGIGPSKAAKLAAKFAADWENALDFRQAEMARCAGVKIDTILLLRDEWRKTAAYNQAATWLAGFGLTNWQIRSIVERFGNSTISILKENPYKIAGEIKGFGFKRLDLAALKMGIEPTHPGRLRAALIYVLEEAAEQQGHTRTPRGDVLGAAGELLRLDRPDGAEIIGAAIDAAAADGEILEEAGDLALPYLRAAEAEILERLTLWRDLPARPGLRPVVEGLTAGQVEAMTEAARRPAMVITGGAGAGKTHVARAIIDMYEAAGAGRVVQCAPTGKAAQRMEESTGRPASTIHRLLGYNGEQWLAETPIAADLVIVDEASMVDVVLLRRLLCAFDPTHTALIIIGDHNQLPPVGPGNALRDIISTGLVPVVHLSEIVRQSGNLRACCARILQGVVPSGGYSPSAPWSVVSALAEPADVSAWLEWALGGYILLFGEDTPNVVQILTPARRTSSALGVRALNEQLQRLYQDRLWDVQVEPPEGRARLKFLRHDRVIQRHNSYTLGVMNGTLGTIESEESQGKMLVRFDGVAQPLELSRESGHFDDLDHAYALTIHQVQGSEFPVAIVVCHKSHSFQHHRNLLYTGVTRAKQSAVIIGDHWGIRNCAAKVESDRRRTWLQRANEKDL